MCWREGIVSARVRGEREEGEGVGWGGTGCGVRAGGRVVCVVEYVTRATHAATLGAFALAGGCGLLGQPRHRIEWLGPRERPRSRKVGNLPTVTRPTKWASGALPYAHLRAPNLFRAVFTQTLLGPDGEDERIRQCHVESIRSEILPDTDMIRRYMPFSVVFSAVFGWRLSLLFLFFVKARVAVLHRHHNRKFVRRSAFLISFRFCTHLVTMATRSASGLDVSEQLYGTRSSFWHRWPSDQTPCDTHREIDALYHSKVLFRKWFEDEANYSKKRLTIRVEASSMDKGSEPKMKLSY